VLALALVACTGNGPDGPTPSGPSIPTPSRTQTESASPSATAADCEPFGATVEATSADPLALSRRTGHSMRVGRHDCYERFVFEMAGSGGDPGWRVRYRDPLTGQGSGEPIDLLGGTTIEILVGVMTVTEFEGRPEQWPPFTGPDDIVTTGFVALQEARMLYGFEGTTQIGVGVDRVRPFRVLRLADPARLVVDIDTGTPLG
jgi:hypothetical protein